jgi:GntR family transcriptional regulator
MSENSRLLDHFVIDLDNPLPRYQQIKQNIVDLIQASLLQAGDALPSERDLSAIYGVNRMTVRQAITELSTEGLLRRQHGVGTFVVGHHNVPAFVPAVMGFSERFQRAGMTPTSQVIKQAVIPASKAVARALRLEPESPVVFLQRLRLVDDEPLMIESSYLSHAIYPDLLDQDFARHSLYNVLVERYHTRLVETEHTLEPTVLTPEESRWFDLPGGQPAMLVHVWAYTHQRQPVEFCKSIIRGDRCRYYFTSSTQNPAIF